MYMKGLVQTLEFILSPYHHEMQNQLFFDIHQNIEIDPENYKII